MIEQILTTLGDDKNQKDYVTALSMFQTGAPLKKPEADKLAALYEKYGTDAAHPELARLYMAVDLLPGRSREDAAVFAPLGLQEADLSALFTAKETAVMLRKEETPDTDTVDAAVAAATDGSLSKPVALFLARSLLNGLAWRWDFGGFRSQAAALAAFLIGEGEETMAEYEIFAEEMRRKCRN